MSDRKDALLRSRQVKLTHLRQRGVDPYPPRFTRTCDAVTAIAQFEAAEAGNQSESGKSPQPPFSKGRMEEVEAGGPGGISLAGRIMAMRVMGKATFLDLKDASGTIQIMLRQNVLGEGYALLEDLDLGDIIGVTGPVMRTRTGQVTIEAHQLTLLTKTMRPMPEKWHGLRDQEVRYRQRYLDLIANPPVRQVFVQRSQIINGIRNFLNRRGFLEVDTPLLVPVAAGAHARPFVTHHNALDLQLYLRIATELYLKRLIVGGMEKVYELGRVFRNEGIDQDHNPEFTLLESYEAYADYNDVMQMVEEMVSTVAQELHGAMKVPFGEQVLDFTPPWRRVSLRQELHDRSGIDLEEYTDDATLARRAIELGLEISPQESRGRLIDKLISTLVEPHLVQPTFVLDYPEVMSPLAKAKPDDPGYVERFEAFAAGTEIANSYSELNDPAVQRQRFEAQEQIRRLYGDQDVDRKDDDFLLALEHGMPPTGGLGMGIDRLVMLLTGQTTIRDALLFPQMRGSMSTDH